MIRELLANILRRGIDIVDLVSSPERSFSTTERETDRPSHGSISNQQQLSMSPTSSSNFRKGGDDDDAAALLFCKFKLEECELSDVTIFLDSHLEKHPPEQMLLYSKDHSIKPITDVIQWMSEHENCLTAGTQEDSRAKRILLVDSLNGVGAMQALLEEMQKKRRKLVRTKRDLITVYDWRVLEHISVMEDDSIERKYYDGFSSPWRRWYCGLV